MGLDFIQRGFQIWFVAMSVIWIFVVMLVADLAGSVIRTVFCNKMPVVIGILRLKGYTVGSCLKNPEIG